MEKFNLIYYINMGYPSIEYSLEKAELYLSNGVKALQFDLPSRNPYRETPFVKERMAYAFDRYKSYEPFLVALEKFRGQHPSFEMQMVSYEDVILTVGTQRYIKFCKDNNITICRISGDGVIEFARKDLNDAGIDTLTFIDYNMPDSDIEFARHTGRSVMLRNVRADMAPRQSLEGWGERIRFLRGKGILADIYATAGITCGTDLLEAKSSGARGAFVGSCLMKLWNNEKETLALLKELEEAANA